MSRAQFDLGARLRAAHAATPVPTAAYAPAIPPTSGIAVTVDTDGEHVYLAATDDTTGRTITGTDRAGLDALASLGVTITAPRRPVVVGTSRDLATLTALARAYPDADASPVIGWWDDRRDYPGTDAVHIVTDTARLRWTLGVHPDREREIDTWGQWLGVTTTGPQRLLDLARRTTSGPLLPGILHASILDTASWERYTHRLSAGRPWWVKDTRIDAALGLIGRSHAAEWYGSIRLDDPLVALAAAHDGTVVPSTIIDRSEASVVVAADRPLSRLRVDSKVTAWLGEPVNAGAVSCLTGSVSAASIDTAARLTITISGLPRRGGDLKAGDRLTLRPGRVDPNMQANARRLAAAGYRRGTNWIAGRGNPVPRRGDVPLDVIVAAAEE